MRESVPRAIANALYLNIEEPLARGANPDVHFGRKSPGSFSSAVSKISYGVPLIQVKELKLKKHVIIENTKVTGVNAFEEIVRVADIIELRDPLSDKLIGMVKAWELAAARGARQGASCGQPLQRKYRSRHSMQTKNQQSPAL